MTTDPSRSLLFPDPAEKAFLTPISWLPLTNPFGPAWAELERAIVPEGDLPDGRAPDDVVAQVSEEIQRHVAVVAARIRDNGRFSEKIERDIAAASRPGRDGAPVFAEEMAVYRGAAIYALLDRFRAEIQKIIKTDGVEVPFLDDYEATYHRFHLDMQFLRVPSPRHLLSLMYQWRRNVFYTAKLIRGCSAILGEVRAAIYRANMGGEACAYARGLYRSMARIPVLITGETGTGKDLAAQCIGQGQYIPMHEKEARFVMRHRTAMHTRSPCESPRELVESAFFGHKRGSFTGATADMTGFFGLPEEHGSLFLDEIGEIAEHVQAKLLRPLENREIVPIGETRPRPIQGRHIFATNRDLEAMCAAKEFREDLLERMNGVRIHMPSFRTILAEDPGHLAWYVRLFIAEKLDDEQERSRWTKRISAYTAEKLAGHGWPRNLRELKNFTERYLITDGEMPEPTVIPSPSQPVAQPPAPVAPPITPVEQPTAPAAPAQEQAAEGHAAPESVCMPSSGLLGWKAKNGEVSVAEITRALVTEVYARNGQNLAQTARLTGLERRKAAQLIDPARLERRLSRLQGPPLNSKKADEP